MTEQIKPKIRIRDLLRRPIKLFTTTDEDYDKAMVQWNKEVGIDAGPKTVINLTQNVYTLKNKKTGELIKLKPEDYEVIEQEE